MHRQGIALSACLIAFGACGGSSGSSGSTGGGGGGGEIENKDVPVEPNAPTGPVLEATKLSGPYATIEEYCVEYLSGAEVQTAIDEGLPVPVCDPIKRCDPKEALALRGEIADVVMLDVTEFAQGFCNLAIKTRLGWFVRAKSMDTYIESGVIHLGAGARGWSMRDGGPGNTPVLMVDYWEESSIQTSAGGEDFSMDQTFVCGVGEAGTPSCVNAPRKWRYQSFQYTEDGDVQDQTVDDVDVSYELTIEDGILTVTGDASALPDELRKELAPAIGAHSLVFP